MDPFLVEMTRQREATARVLATEDGRLMLAMLQRLFDGDKLTGATAEETYQNIGKRDVVRFLLQAQRAGK